MNKFNQVQLVNRETRLKTLLPHTPLRVVMKYLALRQCGQLSIDVVFIINRINLLRID